MEGAKPEPTGAQLIEKSAAAPSAPSAAGSPARLVTSGLAAGLLAGALLGVCEAIVILVSANEGADRQVLWYGTLLYALLTGAVGAAAGLAASFLGARRPTPDLFSAIFIPASLAVGGLLLGRFRISRDVLGEHPMTAAQQLTLIGWAILFFLCLALPLYSLAGRRSTYVILRPAIHALMAGVVLVCAVFFATAMAPALPRVAPAPRSVPAALADRPNVILIMVDTLRADRLPAYGYRGIATPAIDALAADAAVYKHAIAQASWTKPSAASLLTGLYPSTHQAYRKADLLPEAVTTLPEAMRKAGWRTGGIVTNINLAPSFQFDQGYDEYLYLAPDYFFGATESSSKLAAYNGLRLVRERFLSRRKDVRHYYQDAATTTRAARAWLDRNGQSRFFLFLHYMDPHDPYFVHPYDGRAVARVDTPRPDPSRARELSDLYDGEIVFLDQHLGELIHDLKRRGLYDQTLIILTADHGEEFHEHGGWWHGTTLYDEQIHVPLIVKPPVSAPGAPRGSIEGIARSIDVAPTVLMFCGLAKVGAMQGTSLVAAQPGDEAFSEEDFEGNRLRALRSSRWKLIEANPGNPRGLLEQELYALDTDPSERQNLARRDTGRTRSMRGRIDHVLGAALKAAVAAKQGRIDAETRQRLKALGYVQ